MEVTQRRMLAFCESFLQVEYLRDVKDRRFDGRVVLLNLGRSDVVIEGSPLNPRRSSIYSSVVVPHAERFMCIVLPEEILALGPFPFAAHIKRNWTHVYDIFRLPHLKDTPLWRSKKDRIEDLEFNLWYASAGADCGIHNEHDFKEVHTQIFGVGRMQKFRENDRNSLYQDVLMAPGYTHEPFYDDHGMYPWHQYHADTDCVWLAIELHTG